MKFNNKFDIFSLKNIEQEKDTCNVTILLTEKCNYKCNYCYCRKDKNPESISITNFYKIIEFIKLQNKKFNKIILTGGEPTTHPNFKEIIYLLGAHFKENTKILINTNNTNPHILYSVDNLKLYVTTSYHPHRVSDHSQWFEQLRHLKNKHDISVYLMFEEIEDRHLLEKIYREYHDEFFLQIRPIYEKMNLPQYKSEWELLSEIIEPHNVPASCDFYGSVCKAPFIIKSNGDMWRCWEEASHKKPCTNIFNKNLKKENEMYLCTSKQCLDGQFYIKYSIQYYNKYKEKKHG